MSPLSDFAQAERADTEAREAELDAAVDDVLAEMDMPEPRHEREAPAIEPDDPDAWIDEALAEMELEDAQEREQGLELEM